MKRFLLTIGCLISFNLASKAQVEVQGLSIENLRPVEELVTIAIERSSDIKALNVSQLQKDQEIAIDKKKWLQHLSLAAGVNYGNGIVADQLTGDQVGTSLTYLARQNVTYNIGFNIRLPFTEVSSRKNVIKIKSLEIEKLDHLKTSQEDVLRKEIIQVYSNLKHFITSIEVQSEVVESNEMALTIAEGYFKAGKIGMEQYRMAVESRYSSKLEFEKAKNEAWLAYNTLKAIVGEEILK